MEDPQIYFKRKCRERLIARNFDQRAAESAVARAYDWMEIPRPLWTVCVDGPFQLLLIPPILFKILRSEQFMSIVEECSGTSASADEKWNQHWPELWKPAEEFLAQRFDSARAEVLLNLDSFNLSIYRPKNTSGNIVARELAKVVELIALKLKAELRSRLREADAKSWQTLRESIQSAYKCTFPVNSVEYELDINTRTRSLESAVGELRKGVFMARFEKGIDLKKSEFNQLTRTQKQLSDFYSTLISGIGVRLMDLPGMPLPSLREILWSGWNAEWLIAERYLMENLHFKHQDDYEEHMRIVEDLADTTFAGFLSDGVAFICDWPTSVMLDEHNRYHCTNGPALDFEDGFRYYSLHGHQIVKATRRPGQLATQRVSSW